MPAIENRGRILLVVEQGLALPLTNELRRLQQDLVGDGWQVAQATVSRHDATITNGAQRLAQLNEVRAAISNAWYPDTNQLKSVYLIGRVPVPYTLVVQDAYWAVWGGTPYPPDGHDTHAGCWPSDLYYTDVTGPAWADTTTIWTNTTYPRCSTYPGDGKFDEYELPSPVELQIGRVDLSQMPAFSLSETELVRHYLDKVHQYRLGQMPFPPRGAVTDDRTSVRRSIPCWFGTNSYSIMNFKTAMADTNGYTLAYANGAGGFTSVGTHYTTFDVVNLDPHFFLQISLGSYFGDWDYTNDLLRATLAGNSGGLAALWDLDFGQGYDLVASDWSLGHMALGQTLGYGVQYTQNRAFEGTSKLVQPSPCFSLLGDPSLRLYPVLPAGLVSASNQSSNVVLSWGPSGQGNLLGYYVYSSTNGFWGPYRRISGAAPVASTTFTDLNALPGTPYYQVRAVALQVTGGGSFTNLSQGGFAMASSDSRPYVTIGLSDARVSEGLGRPVTFQFTRTGSLQSDLPVSYQISGNATNGQDYTATLTGLIVIPAGQLSANILVTPVDNAWLDGVRTLTLQLQTNAAYQAGIDSAQTLTILDNDVLPPSPSNLTAEAVNNTIQVGWQDMSTNETRFIIERREVSTGGTVIMDNENTNMVSWFSNSAAWTIQTFSNAYGGNCRTTKNSSGAYYAEYRPGLSTNGEYDLDIWYPSASTGGSMTQSQSVMVASAAATNWVALDTTINGGGWNTLGHFTLSTSSFMRVSGTSATNTEYKCADALRLRKSFSVLTQVMANATGFVDVAVSNPGVYEYRVSAGLANTSSWPSAVARVVLGAAPANRVPVVEAGNNQTTILPLGVSQGTLPLTGSASDPDDGPGLLSTTWVLLSGPSGIIIGNSNALNTTVTLTNNGSYVIGLLAFDGSVTVTDSVTLAVQLTSSSTNAQSFVADTNTVALWHLNGDGSDASGNGYALVFTNNPTFSSNATAMAWMSSPSGAALRVTYPQMAVGIIPSYLFTNHMPITIEERVFMNAWGPNNASYIYCGFSVNWDCAFLLQQQSWGLPVIKGWNSTVVVATNQMVSSLTTGVWHHLMMTFNGTNQYQAFLDGVLLGTYATNAPNWGRSAYFTNQFGNFDGYLDEIRISRVVRTYQPPPQYVTLRGLVTGSGMVFPELTNVLQGGAVTMTATPSNYYHVAEIDTNTGLLSATWPTGTVSFVWSNLQVSGTALVSFVQNTAPQGTPEIWMSQYGSPLNFSIMETSLAVNGFTYGDSYIAGLVPTNPLSIFRITTISNPPGSRDFFFSALTDRTYTLKWSTSLVDQLWYVVPGQSNLWGANGTMVLHDNSGAPLRFYRLEVRKP